MTGSSARSTAGAETSSFVTQPEPTSEAPSANHLDIGGAPVENASPLGREISLFSAVMLNVGHITGSGIYATPGVVLNSLGSTGLLLLFWALAPFFAFAGLSLYSELASMFPHRSGAEVVYLEQAYPRPKFFVSTLFAVTAILMSFSAGSATIFAQYSLTAFDVPVNAFNQKLLALAVVFVAVGGVGLSTRWSLRIVNLLTFLKIISLAFMVATGVAVLFGATHIKDPYANFHDMFDGSKSNPNAIATSLVKVNHAFVGWHSAFRVLAEVKGSDPVRTVRRSGIISLSLVSLLFLFINVAYVAVIPREEIQGSGQLIAALFFRRVFGPWFGVKVLPLLVALSCFGNLSRMIREVARQGLLPYPRIFSSTKPFGTPFAPAALMGVFTCSTILALPARDAFNFIVDLVSYPSLIFQCAMCVGVWVLRKRRLLVGLPRVAFQARNSLIIVYLSSCIFLLVMPWVPPEPGQGDVSFWHATYCIAGIAILLCCGFYYWVWIVFLPRLGGYEVVEEIEEQTDGARNTHLVRRYKGKDGEREPLLWG
ncbi:amino acid transporter [Tricholoma matsutake]|nr:amino acid transporter [Tricholoma matsutake 945]